MNFVFFFFIILLLFCKGKEPEKKEVFDETIQFEDVYFIEEIVEEIIKPEDIIEEVFNEDIEIEKDVSIDEINEFKYDKFETLETEIITEKKKLCSYELKEDDKIDIDGCHNSIYAPPNYFEFYPILKRMWALEDGKTIRIGIFWINGHGVYVNKKHLEEKYDKIWVYFPIPYLLPTGIIYYDINTETDEVKFVDEIVFNPAEIEALKRSADLYAHFFYPAGKKKFIEYEINGKKYRMNIRCEYYYQCRTDINPLTEEIEETIPELIEINLKKREINLLQVWHPYKKVIPFPFDIELLSNEKIWLSGCECKIPFEGVQTHYNCPDFENEFYGCWKHLKEQEWNCCDTNKVLEELKKSGEIGFKAFSHFYLIPYEGENGIIFSPNCEWIEQIEINKAGITEYYGKYSDFSDFTENDIPLSYSIHSLIFSGVQPFSDQFKSIKYEPIYTPNMELIDVCYFYTSSLLKGAYYKIEIENLEKKNLGKFKATRYLGVIEPPEFFPPPSEGWEKFDYTKPCELVNPLSIPIWDF